MRLLLTWSDRAVPQGPHAARGRDPSDRGPVMRLLEQKESRDQYDAAWVLTTPEHARGAKTLAADMHVRIADVTVHVLDVTDPSDYAPLFAAVAPLAAKIPKDAEVTVVLSAGTPQAQTLWVLMVKSGMLPARMLQVIPPAFVPRPHPKALREVTLDVPGLPEIRALREEVVQLRAREDARSGLIGASPAMQALSRRIARVATARVPVLISGETGSGKELVARAVHRASDRRDGPFLAENCGALPEGTLTSELFGHERGAFTGAVERRKGLFELAHGGTLFLDELGEMGPRVQVGLLRVLEEGTLRRVGGEQEVKVDVRIVAATHRDLTKMVKDGTFREDLYYRLKGAVLEVPPLRERVSDLETLIVTFLDQIGGTRPMPTRSALRALARYTWPGNVRELRAEVARWVVFCDERVDVEDLSPEIRECVEAATSASSSERPHRPREVRTLAEHVHAVERAVIDETLARNAGNLAKSARELGIDRNTLKRKIRGA